ncbi:hypothetical protein MAPG_07459 [Magnaporthiopsis poae ATCC 64411]|uniref:Uncharacterized protein n=1 Tax=Magnaporthiopsis poae (strain ATCC 64411 / 73-15) TaxID=644358 RepID=A0A0C4E4R0_MAGP6|nr:hypothetical protein MAPG_07459 [Magnaporthiopsis poae ATCC 64411]
MASVQEGPGCQHPPQRCRGASGSGPAYTPTRSLAVAARRGEEKSDRSNSTKCLHGRGSRTGQRMQLGWLVGPVGGVQEHLLPPSLKQGSPVLVSSGLFGPRDGSLHKNGEG